MRVDRVSDLDMRATMLQNQMERDLAGAFAPTDFSATSTTENLSPLFKASAKKEDQRKLKKSFGETKHLKRLPLSPTIHCKPIGVNDQANLNQKSCALCID